MIVIAETYARYAETLPDSELNSAAERLFQFADGVCREYFAERYEQFGITVITRVEVGSTRTWITIGAMFQMLFFWGDLRQSIDFLAKDGQWLSQHILPHITSTIGLQASQPTREERRRGIPGQLERLFARVERGDMTAEEATKRAIHLLQATGDTDTANELPHLTQKLEAEFTETARQQVTQLTLPGAEFTETPHQRGTVLTLAEDVNDTDHARSTTQHQRPREIEIALPPRTPARRRRGVIATRDSTTGHIVFRSYEG